MRHGEVRAKCAARKSSSSRRSPSIPDTWPVQASWISSLHLDSQRICLTPEHLRKPRFSGCKTLRMGARSIEVLQGRCSQTCRAACWRDRISGAGKPCPIGHLLSGSGSQAASFASCAQIPSLTRLVNMLILHFRTSPRKSQGSVGVPLVTGG